VAWEQLKVLILIVPNASIITRIIFVLTLYILLISISRYLFLLNFSLPFVLNFELSGMAISISRQAFSLLSSSTIRGQFPSIVRSLITGTCHVMVVPLTFMTFSIVANLSVTCNAVSSGECN